MEGGSHAQILTRFWTFRARGGIFRRGFVGAGQSHRLLGGHWKHRLFGSVGPSGTGIVVTPRSPALDGKSQLNARQQQKRRYGERNVVRVKPHDKQIVSPKPLPYKQNISFFKNLFGKFSEGWASDGRRADRADGSRVWVAFGVGYIPFEGTITAG